MARKALFSDDLYLPCEPYVPVPGRAPIPRICPEIHLWAVSAVRWALRYLSDNRTVCEGICSAIPALVRFTCDDYVIKESGEQFLLVTAQQLADFLSDGGRGDTWSKRHAMHVLHMLCLNCGEADGDFYWKQSERLKAEGVEPLLKVYEAGWTGRATSYRYVGLSERLRDASLEVERRANLKESDVADGFTSGNAGEVPDRALGDGCPIGRVTVAQTSDTGVQFGDVNLASGDVTDCSAGSSNRSNGVHVGHIHSLDNHVDTLHQSKSSNKKNDVNVENSTSPSSPLSLRNIPPSLGGQKDRGSDLEEAFAAFLRAFGNGAGNKREETLRAFEGLVKRGYKPEFLVGSAAAYQKAIIEPDRRIIFPLVFLRRVDLIEKYGGAFRRVPRLDPNWRLEKAGIALSKGRIEEEIFIVGPDGAPRPTGELLKPDMVGAGEDRASAARRILCESPRREEIERIAREPASRAV